MNRCSSIPVDVKPERLIADQLWQAIKGKGAFRYFKDTLRRLRLDDRWYRHREEAMKRFVLEWAEDHGVTVEDVPRTPDG